MKALVVYDTNYGNTKKLAETIATNIDKNAKVTHASDVDGQDLQGLDLLVVGCPIIAWGPTAGTKKFLGKLRSADLTSVKAAAFDTRMNISIHGDACKKISGKLQAAGADLVLEPQFFYVADKEGPLAGGELEKAAEWALAIRKNLDLTASFGGN